MPIALDPAETFDLSLESDRLKHRDHGTPLPVFVFHYLTGGEWRARLAILARLDAFYAVGPEKRDTDAHETIMQDVYAAIREHLVGWKQLTGRDGKLIPFDVARIASILTDPEARELATASCRMSELGGSEKNASESPSPSSSESPAPAAAPAATAAVPRP